MTVQISTFQGGEAFSPFKTQRLLQTLQQTAPSISGLTVKQVFLVGTAKALSKTDSQRMSRLLDATASAPPTPAAQEVTWWVSPRLGTVSPWASKASDIARNCGFAVQRIERLMEYRLATRQPLSQAQTQALQAQLHDP